MFFITTQTTTFVPNMRIVHLVSTDKTGIIEYWQMIAEFPQHDMKYSCNIKSFLDMILSLLSFSLKQPRLVNFNRLKPNRATFVMLNSTQIH